MSVFDSAFMTRIPAMSSLTRRTKRSTASCTFVYIGTPLLENKYTRSAMTGRSASMIHVSDASIESVTARPPISMIG